MGMNLIGEWLMAAFLIVKHILQYFFLVLPIEIAGIICLPFILPFIPKQREELPHVFRWLDNHEIHLDIYNRFSNIDGLMGPWYYRLDRGINVGYISHSDGTVQRITRRSEIYEAGVAWQTVRFGENIGYWRRIWERYVWLALRNPCYYFKWKVMGFQWDSSQWRLKTIKSNATDEQIFRGLTFKLGDDRENERFGWYYEVIENLKGKRLFEFYLYMPYWPNAPIGARIRMGHKLKNINKLDEGQYVQFELSPNPFRGIDKPK